MMKRYFTEKAEEPYPYSVSITICVAQYLDNITHQYRDFVHRIMMLLLLSFHFLPLKMVI